MKNIFFLLFALSILTACRDSASTPASTNAVPTGPALDTTSEKTGIALAVRGFFGWYGKFMNSPEVGSEELNFMDDSGPHYKIKAAVLDKYLNEFVKSGYAGQAFVEREKEFYQKAENHWQTEPKGDIPTGMDADHYLCAQEDMTEYYPKAPLRISFGGADRATATLSLDDETFKSTLNVFVKKENGKWVYVGTECATGVE